MLSTAGFTLPLAGRTAVRRALVSVALLLAAAFALPARVNAEVGASDEYFGVNAGEVFLAPQSQWDAQLSAMAQGGLQAVRTDARWATAEPAAPSPSTAHSYQWATFDSQVAALAAHGLRWYPILDYGPLWAGVAPGDSTSAPAGNDNFAGYAAALAARYGTGGSFWRDHPELTPLPVRSYEVWNEENAKLFWHPQDSAAERYADLYLAARGAIRQADPAAQVVIGGLALVNTDVTDESDFVRRMYRHRPDLQGNVDAIGFHPYAATVSGIEQKLHDFRATLVSVRASAVPLEITEVGWTTVRTNEADRAAALTSLAQDLPRSDCGVRRLMPYAWVTGEYAPSNPEHWFGIFNKDGTPKPSGTAYLDAVRQMRGMSPSPPAGGTLDICDSGSDASAAPAGRPRGPTLRLRVAKVERHRVTVVTRCPRGCALRLELGRPGAVSSSRRARLARRSFGFSSKRRTVKLRVRGGRRHVVLEAFATRKSGGQTSRRRALRLHR